MDPDEALRIIRGLVKQMGEERKYLAPAPGTITSNFVQHADDLIEEVMALDVWITTGGFLPKSWDGRVLNQKEAAPATTEHPHDFGYYEEN